MSRTWFISDTHFNHANIIKYCDRPFKDVSEMNKFLIKQWNNTVKKTDTVWFLGDFALGGRDECKQLLSQLNGQIYMIRGNHDNFPDSFYYDCGIKFISKYPVVLKKKFILSHAPLEMEDETLFHNIYGHVHNKGNETFAKNSTCVCVERHNYKPIELEIFNKTN